MDKEHFRSIVILAFLALLGIPCAHARDSARSFGYVSPQYIITAEVAGSHTFVLNFINLSDYVIVVQPSEFIYKGASGRFYIGQVFEQETKGTKGEVYKYSASILLRSLSFTGLNVVGAFHEQDSIDELSIRIGAKRFYLQQLDKLQFEQLASKIGDLDLKTTASQAALQDAGIAETGTVKSTDGTSEWDRDWEGLIGADGINPPKIIEHPEATPTEEALRSNTFGAVKLSATITKDGVIEDLKVIKALGHGLDERAVEVVKNSWIFLPATRNGEVLETSIRFDVVFAPPRK